MKKHITILLFLLLNNCYLSAQDTTAINERYSLGYNYCLFGEVIATDSCYYVKGMVSNIVSYVDNIDAFICFDTLGTPQIVKLLTNDTLGFDSWENYNFIKTLDGNFVQMIRMFNNYGGMFVKYTPQGDTILTVFNDSLINQPNFNTTGINGLFQNKDSTFIGMIYTNNLTEGYLGYTFYKLNKMGELLFFNTYFPPPPFFTGSTGNLLKYNDTLTLFAYPTYYGGNFYHKLLFLDTLLNITQTKTIYYQDTTQNPEINSLTKTSDGGLLYCGALGKFDFNSNGYDYKASITKLDSNFNLEWILCPRDEFINNYQYNHFERVLTVNDSEFVVVGIGAGQLYPNDTTVLAKYGWLVKFNKHGEVLWQRKFIKVPHYDGEPQWAEHYLYDIDITKDSGFVMVGQSINYYHTNPHPYGQMGWLVKTDKYGCLVPNCQQYDNIDTTQTPPTDSTTTPQIETSLLYPNPASTQLFYYNVYQQDEPIEPRTCFIFNTQGQIVQKFTASTNKTTYIIDVSQLASSTYIFKVINSKGVLVKSSKFVVIH